MGLFHIISVTSQLKRRTLISAYLQNILHAYQIHTHAHTYDYYRTVPFIHVYIHVYSESIQALFGSSLGREAAPFP
jgi:hypothetical protein